MEMVIMYNPWAGLSSYQDPETSESHLKFCGRDNESYDVADLIDNNIFVTLYGKSGTGKTSLLNAGVFPRLRMERYLPISVRLGMEARDVSFQKCLIAKVEQAVTKNGSIIDTDVVTLPGDEQMTEYLWSYFACKRFLNSDGQTMFPVFVLDQFEEVFRERRQETEVLLRQIYYMMDESHALGDRTLPDGRAYSYDYNFRFVVAIREDDLFLLEDSIDNNFLQNMKRCRYRLRNLSTEGAGDAILIPGDDLFVEEDKDKIADTIISISRNKTDQSISANILSLICNRIFEKCRREGLSHANLALVETFVKGNPFEQFYKEATRGLSEREKAYIETHMVDSDGRRNSVSESDFLQHVKHGEQLLEGDCRILQRSSASSDGSTYRIELRHDSFCETLSALKEKRVRRKKLRRYVMAAVAILALMSAMVFVSNIYNENVRHKEISKLREAENQKLKETALLKEAKIRFDKAEKEKVDSMLVMAKAKVQLLSTIETQNVSLRYKEEQLKHRQLELENINAELECVIDSLNKSRADNEKLQNEVQNLEMMVDGIEYAPRDSTSTGIEEWKQRNASICAEKIKTLLGDYNIPQDMIENEPCLVYLVLKSRSLSDKKEKQSWFDLYSLMSYKQKIKLYNILFRETYKLAEIKKKYEYRKTEIAKKQTEYLDNYSASELNEYAYEQARQENWGIAIQAIDKAINKDPSNAAYYDSKGEILFDKGNESEAVQMWNKVMELDPDFLEKYDGSTPFYEKLKQRGLISAPNQQDIP